MEDDDGWMDPVSIGMISEQDAEQLIARCALPFSLGFEQVI